MKNLFKRKQCKQCGWELKLFSGQKFCSVECVALWEKNLREYEELKRKNRKVNK